MTNLTELDRLTTAATAFRNWAQLLESMSTGYFPTLHKGNTAQAQLGQALEAKSMRVFWIGEVAHAA